MAHMQRLQMLGKIVALIAGLQNMHGLQGAYAAPLNGQADLASLAGLQNMHGLHGACLAPCCGLVCNPVLLWVQISLLYTSLSESVGTFHTQVSGGTTLHTHL